MTKIWWQECEHNGFDYKNINRSCLLGMSFYLFSSLAEISKNIAAWKNREASKAMSPFASSASCAFKRNAYSRAEGMSKSMLLPAIKAITIAAQPKPLEKLLWHILYVPKIEKKPVSACIALEDAMPIMRVFLFAKPANFANSVLSPDILKRYPVFVFSKNK